MRFTDQRKTNEASLLRRVIDPGKPSLSVAAAQSILTIEFPPEDKQRMHELAARARAGTLTPDEELEIDTYGRVGSLIGILKSKARQSVKRHANGHK